MKKLIKDILVSLKKQPVWTVYSLILSPIFYLSVAVAALMLSLINLNVEDGVTFWQENT